MCWSLTDALMHGFLDNSRDGIVSGRLVFLRAHEPVEVDIDDSRVDDEGVELATPFEVTLSLRGNLPAPFRGSGLRIEKSDEMPDDPPSLDDFPQNHSGELLRVNLVDGHLYLLWQAHGSTEQFSVELDIPVDWVTHEVC